jgi:hypothetical protein
MAPGLTGFEPTSPSGTACAARPATARSGAVSAHGSLLPMPSPSQTAATSDSAPTTMTGTAPTGK